MQLIVDVSRRQLALRQEARDAGIELAEPPMAYPLAPPRGDTAAYRDFLEAQETEAEKTARRERARARRPSKPRKRQHDAWRGRKAVSLAEAIDA